MARPPLRGGVPYPLGRSGEPPTLRSALWADQTPDPRKCRQDRRHTNTVPEATDGKPWHTAGARLRGTAHTFGDGNQRALSPLRGCVIGATCINCDND